jgi:hypothetical protein
MSRNGDTLLDWGGEERLFRLAWGELEKLQEACDAGPFHILAALRSGLPRTEHVLEPIRWGLIGGGLSATEANKLVSLWIKERPLAENMIPAQAILTIALYGDPDEEEEGDKPGKPEAGAS